MKKLFLVIIVALVVIAPASVLAESSYPNEVWNKKEPYIITGVWAYLGDGISGGASIFCREGETRYLVSICVEKSKIVGYKIFKLEQRKEWHKRKNGTRYFIRMVRRTPFSGNPHRIFGKEKWELIKGEFFKR